MSLQVGSLADWELQGKKNLLSIVMPARNEEGNVEQTVRTLTRALGSADIQHEIVVINDNSEDGTERVLRRLESELPTVRYCNNDPPSGYGLAVRLGLASFNGAAVVIVMADGSDDPEDVVRFYRKLSEGYDCVFGSRFARGARVTDYPRHKLFMNRIGNAMIRSLFLMRYNDTSNAFKMYRRHVIAGVQPLLSHHFNLTVELPLKSIVRGYSYAVVPNSWANRREGVSKFRIKEMGSRYLFVILYCLLEKLLSRDDFKREREYRAKQLQVWPR
jgi:dolichol-phosphate mannosyltransferase